MKKYVIKHEGKIVAESTDVKAMMEEVLERAKKIKENDYVTLEIVEEE